MSDPFFDLCRQADQAYRPPTPPAHLLKPSEKGLRCIANSKGYRLVKGRRPTQLDHGLYALLLDHDTGGAVNPPLAGSWIHSWTLDEVAGFLKGRA